MNEFDLSRRDVLKASGVGIVGLAGVSSMSVPAAAHERIDTSVTDLLGPVQVPANSEEGFNYPYYLYLPETTQEEPVPILVEPNNSGFLSDDLGEHRSAVKDRLADGLGHQLYSKALSVPLLVPVFPRPDGEIASHLTYTHALDEDSVKLEETDLARVDRQLVKMIEHAQELLTDLSYPVADDVLMNGFSASGNFVNRFAALHPDKVRSLSAGGINGTPILPLERAKGSELDYPIGIENIEELTGEPFDAVRWRDVSQFLYLGGEDENDTIPYADAWSDRHKQIAINVYGEDMQEDRMPYSEAVYDEAGSDATFKVYDGVGHTPVPLQIQQDIASFHRRKAELKQLSFTDHPTAGETTIQFETRIFGHQEYHLRVRSAERGDITETPASVTTNEQATSTVSLSTAVEDEEEIVGVVLPVGTTNPDNAVASVSTGGSQLPLLNIVTSPTASSPNITIEYGVDDSYQTSSPIHLFIRGSSGTSMLTTFEPGTVRTETFDLSDEEFDVTIADATELTVTLDDVDDDSTLTSTSTVIGDENETEDTASTTASVSFSTHPTDTQDRLEVTYDIEDRYEPNKALRLQGEIGEATFLLDALPVGEEITETFSVEQIPKVAGANISIKAVDDRVLATDRTVVLKDTGGDVTIEYTNLPTGSDRSATVEYSVSESYEVVDTLTLRVYDGTLYGDNPVAAIGLLSPGDSGTETFTIGEDIDSDIADPIVAVVDDVPLAYASIEQSSDETNKDSTETTNEQDSEPTVEDTAGFGFGSAVVSLGGLGYLLKRRHDNE